MLITGLNHITINVTDLEASEFFYQTVLGLEPCGYVDMGDHTLTYFQLPQNVRLELIQYDEKIPSLPAEVKRQGMYRHFCLETDSLEEIVTRCREAGIHITQETAWVEKLHCHNILLEDPNGVEVESIKPEG